jgi:signal transduction histidine kinase
MASGTIEVESVRRLRGGWTSYVRSRWLYALLFAASGGAVLATAMGSYHEIDRELTATALSRRAAVSQLAATTLSEKFNRLVDVAVSLATRVRFRELIAAGSFVEASKILGDVPRDFPFIERLFLTDREGVLMADVPALPGVTGVSFSHRDWYAGVSRHWRPYLSAVYKHAAEPQVAVFAVAVPIKSAAGTVSGILVMQIQPVTFFEWLRGIVFEVDEYVYVVDTKGQAVFHSGFPGRGEPGDFSKVPTVQKVQKGEFGVEIAPDPIGKEDSVSAYAPVTGYGWGIVAQQSTRAAFAAKEQQLSHLLSAYGLTLLLCILGVYLVTRIALERRKTVEGYRMKAQLERLVAERTAQLEAANRELESFSYSVSHDLRAPLRAIDGFSRMVEEDYAAKLDHEGQRLLNIIGASTRRMGQLIEDLLAFSRLSRAPLSVRNVDMTTLVEEVLRELRSHPDTVIPPCAVQKLPSVSSDPALLRQVWTNLLTNAAKFTRTRAQPVIEVSGVVDEHDVVYCVRDNGVGFDMKYYDKLFGVFQRLHNTDEFPGTGVGLAIVQRIVARHGGRVWAEGRLDEGALFYFSLPRVPAS